MRGTLRRRDVLEALLALGVGALVTPARVHGANVDVCGSTLWEGLDVHRLAVLGAEYRESHPQDAGLQDLRDQLADAAKRDAIAKLRSMMLADYSAVRIVPLGGVIVSLTEARLCVVLVECD